MSTLSTRYASCYLGLSILLLSGCGGGSGKTYALLDPNESVANIETYAAKSTVDGLAFRVLWAKLEPQKQSYDWSSLDSAFEIAHAAGKKMTLHVFASTTRAAPSWLVSSGAATYTYTTPAGTAETGFIPWDSVYIEEYSNFITALGQHIASAGYSKDLYAISDTVPTAEMTVLGCVNNIMPNGTPYDRTAYQSAWQTTVQAFSSAFPNKTLFISAPREDLCRNDADGSAFYTELMNFALSINKSATLFAADLKATGSERVDTVSADIISKTKIGFQTIWSATNDPSNRMAGSLSSAICEGWKMKSRYFEIYKSDLDSADPAIQSAIASSRNGKGCN